MSRWYEKGVFYHIYPLGLTGAPRVNDGAALEHRFHELDKWIVHLKSLGCNAVYIGPLFESSSHGYDTKDYRQVDRRLGDEADFKRFTKLCHEAEIKVVVDGVFNHTGRDFFAFRDLQENGTASRYAAWYKNVSFGEGSPVGDSFGYDAWQGHYELACLNLQNQDVKEYIFDTIRFWIEHFAIDGIRLDCANVLDFGFMKELRSETTAMKEDFWLMGEVIHGEYGRWVNDEMLHSVTNYELHKSIYSGHNDHNYFEIAHNVRRLLSVASKLYTFVDNHDEDRIASKLNDLEHLYTVYTLLFTLPGIPSIYYGSEWRILGKRTKTNDEELRPRILIGEEKTLHCALTDQIARLGAIHNANPQFHDGGYEELLLTNRQYAFSRFRDGQAIVVAVNNDGSKADVSIPWRGRGGRATSLLDDGEYSIENQKIAITIPANRGVILKITEG